MPRLVRLRSRLSRKGRNCHKMPRPIDPETKTEEMGRESGDETRPSNCFPQKGHRNQFRQRERERERKTSKTYLLPSSPELERLWVVTREILFPYTALFIHSFARLWRWWFESSPGCWANTVATYYTSRPGNSPNPHLQNLATEWMKSIVYCDFLLSDIVSRSQTAQRPN